MNKIKILSLIFLSLIISCSEDDKQTTVSISDYTVVIDENPNTDESLGIVIAETNRGHLTFSITEQSPNNAFQINSSTGELTVMNNFFFDFETNSTIRGIIKAENGGIYDTANIVININDLDEKIYNVILIAGQSNTHSGTGLDPNLDSPMTEIKQLGRYRGESMKIIDAIEPLQHHTRQSNKIGFGLTYAKLIHEYLKDTKEIIIIPCGFGATGFQDNRWNQDDDLYKDAIKRVRHVILKNPESKLVSILWHQGELDVGNSNYQKNLDDFITNIRNDLEAESVPFILGGMVPYWVNQYDSRKNQQRIISSSTDRHDYIGYADPELPFVIQKNNNTIEEIHYDAKGQRELANRYFEQFVKIIE